MRTTRLLSAGVMAGAAALAAVGANPATAATVDLVEAGSQWQYADDGGDRGTSWRVAGLVADDWPTGRAPLGYGDPWAATELEPSHATYYFRKAFTAPEDAGASAVTMSARFDDGAVVYLNGVEVWRQGVPPAQSAATLANIVKFGSAESQWQTVGLPAGVLLPGSNVIAVEVHNASLSSSDIGLDLSLSLDVAKAEPTGPRVVCRVTDARLPEMSGLAASVRHPGILWAHNDSGDSARIFALDARTCDVRAVVKLAGVSAQDFEAISLGRDAAGQPELWVGDIGDNLATRPNVKLYRFPEPATLDDQEVDPWQVTVNWSDGPHNAESLLVDPVPNGAVYLINKQSDGAIYQLRGDFRETGQATTARLADRLSYATDAAIAPDRSHTIVRSGNYANLYDGAPGGSQVPLRFQFPSQPQGEAVTFSIDSRSMYIGSEGQSDLIVVPVP